jgi:hypothetical protein
MAVPDHARNHTARPGYQLHDAVDLRGWDHRSIWGWDQGTGSFYAQLWRNDSTSEAPDIWLTGARTPYPWPASIALAIVENTEADALTTVRAMGIAHPDPSLLPDDTIMDRADELNKADDRSDYGRGQIHALAWTQGLAEFTTGTRTEWGRNRRPTPEQVDAEHHMVTGQLYRGGTKRDSKDFFAGADELLWWALGR